MESKLVSIPLLQKSYHAIAKKIAAEQGPGLSDDELILFALKEDKDNCQCEGYKYKIIQQTRAILDTYPWANVQLENKNIQNLGMKDLAVNLLNVDRQNLVYWSDIDNFCDLKQTYNLERAFYDLFTSKDTAMDETLFKSLRTSIGNKFALLSYFFFVKDPTNYMVMCPDNFAWRLNKIGASGSCTVSATWKNYSKFMSILREIQAFLLDYQSTTDDITLLDAHSFLWLLHLIKNDKL